MKGWVIRVCRQIQPVANGAIVFALDTDSLGLSGPFTGQDARKAMDGHVLAEAGVVGTYSLNPAVR